MTEVVIIQKPVHDNGLRHERVNFPNIDEKSKVQSLWQFWCLHYTLCLHNTCILFFKMFSLIMLCILRQLFSVCNWHRFIGFIIKSANPFLTMTHFGPLIRFYNPWKPKETSSLRKFLFYFIYLLFFILKSGGEEREFWNTDLNG